MVFHPSRHPDKTFVFITVVVYASIASGYLIDDVYMAIGHVTWMAFTAFLSVKQFLLQKERKKHSNFVELLIFNPEIRFFIFEVIAVIGLGSVLFYRSPAISTLALIAWWLFSLHFYKHYIRKEVEESFTGI